MNPRAGHPRARDAARVRGFTLLEILVALSLLAIGLAAAIRAVTVSTDTVATLQARQLAGWVAENQLTLLRASRSWPALGNSQGAAAMGQLSFVWRMQVSPAPLGRFRRVEIQVYPQDSNDQALSRLVGFLAPPP